MAAANAKYTIQSGEHGGGAWLAFATESCTTLDYASKAALFFDCGNGGTNNLRGLTGTVLKRAVSAANGGNANLAKKANEAIAAAANSASSSTDKGVADAAFIQAFVGEMMTTFHRNWPDHLRSSSVSRDGSADTGSRGGGDGGGSDGDKAENEKKDDAGDGDVEPFVMKVEHRYMDDTLTVKIDMGGCSGGIFELSPGSGYKNFLSSQAALDELGEQKNVRYLALWSDFGQKPNVCAANANKKLFSALSARLLTTGLVSHGLLSGVEVCTHLEALIDGATEARQTGLTSELERERDRAAGSTAIAEAFRAAFAACTFPALDDDGDKNLYKHSLLSGGVNVTIQLAVPQHKFANAGDARAVLTRLMEEREMGVDLRSSKLGAGRRFLMAKFTAPPSPETRKVLMGMTHETLCRNSSSVTAASSSAPRRVYVFLGCSGANGAAHHFKVVPRAGKDISDMIKELAEIMPGQSFLYHMQGAYKGERRALPFKNSKRESLEVMPLTPDGLRSLAVAAHAKSSVTIADISHLGSYTLNKDGTDWISRKQQISSFVARGEHIVEIENVRTDMKDTPALLTALDKWFDKIEATLKKKASGDCGKLSEIYIYTTKTIVIKKTNNSFDVATIILNNVSAADYVVIKDAVQKFSNKSVDTTLNESGCWKLPEALLKIPSVTESYMLAKQEVCSLCLQYGHFQSDSCLQLHVCDNCFRECAPGSCGAGCKGPSKCKEAKARQRDIVRLQRLQYSAVVYATSKQENHKASGDEEHVAGRVPDHCYFPAGQKIMIQLGSDPPVQIGGPKSAEGIDKGIAGLRKINKQARADAQSRQIQDEVDGDVKLAQMLRTANNFPAPGTQPLSTDQQVRMMFTANRANSIRGGNMGTMMASMYGVQVPSMQNHMQVPNQNMIMSSAYGQAHMMHMHRNMYMGGHGMGGAGGMGYGSPMAYSPGPPQLMNQGMMSQTPQPLGSAPASSGLTGGMSNLAPNFYPPLDQSGETRSPRAKKKMKFASSKAAAGQGGQSSRRGSGRQP